MTKNELPTVSIKGNDYVLVKDRILYFNETYPNGAIKSDMVSYTDGQVIVCTKVYPDVSNPERFFTGWSQAKEADGYINKTAALENAESSATGRALAMMGIGVIESIASADEVNKATQPVKKQPVQRVNQVASQTAEQADAELNALDEAEERQALLERKGLLTDEEKAFIKEQQTPTPGVSDKTCEVCSQDLTYREGVSKAGKPYKGWFCSEKDHPVQWVR